ncbi:carboxypeptidase M32 [Cohnella thailandensis]|uniref:Metal-dependent carboxypeptidase n=1 Tax=Cohnella thailandensis TaxID=557557 RepID=A0A841T8Y3_9BACL|nr:carboxypeptidase M32 [Cohnella thailandensis]MBB6638317.1 carboxypeptidase M32 [Cohnella thailandensis]MBP1977205.1 carboxypeptidase Taq [Cohnella thailandensis]
MSDIKDASDPKLERFRELTKQIKQYEEILAAIYWDMRTGAPRKGIGLRSEAYGTLSAETFRLSTSAEMGELLDHLSQPEAIGALGAIDRKQVEETRKDYERNRKLPPELYREYVVLTSQAESAWEEAKRRDDYPGFEPYLEKIIDFNRKFIELWGVKGTPYDTLLDIYEPGMTTSELDRLFGELRARLVPLADAIASRGDKPDTSFLRGTFDIAAQKRFSKFILTRMGFDFEAGRLDESVHPFATGLNPGDVRITTRYLADDLTSALFGSIHEGGHALYEQNIAPELAGTLLCTGTSMGIHESQSRLWENMVGRSLSFWKQFYPELQKQFPGQLDNVGVEQFYRGINVVEPSLIRIEADELTYNLHIMIRYEIEKMIFNEGLSAKELPEVWNAKYKEALGIVPGSDAEGVLQDVHWSGGSFGYFPSYSLGNMYAAQIMNKAKTLRPDLEERIAAGELAPLKEWLTEGVYRHGKMKNPSEIIESITGESLKSAFLCDYLETKYREIYRLG